MAKQRESFKPIFLVCTETATIVFNSYENALKKYLELVNKIVSAESGHVTLKTEYVQDAYEITHFFEYQEGRF